MIERMGSNSGVTRISAALSGRFSPNSAIGSRPFAPSIGVPRLRSSCPVSFRYRDCETQRLGTASEAAPELLRIADSGLDHEDGGQHLRTGVIELACQVSAKNSSQS